VGSSAACALIEEIDVNKLTMLLMLFLIGFIGCATQMGKPFSELGEPDVFCRVIQKPDPLLLGTREGRLSRTGTDWTKIDKEYIKYTLIKFDDQYGLYFYRTWRSGQKRVKEWKNWTINGKEILGGYGVRIFVQGDAVYFTIRGADEPARMSRIESP
jgi:hypothetical protein